MDAKSTEQYNENEKVEAYKQNVAEVFPARLLALRKAIGVSQETFAKKMGVSRGCIAYYESGQRLPDIAFVSAVASVTGCSLDYLFGRNEHMYPDNLLNNIGPDFDSMSNRMLENFTRIQRTSCFERFIDSKEFVSLLEYIDASMMVKSLGFKAITNEIVKYKAAVAFSEIAAKIFDDPDLWAASRFGNDLEPATVLMSELTRMCLSFVGNPGAVDKVIAKSSGNFEQLSQEINDTVAEKEKKHETSSVTHPQSSDNTTRKDKFDEFYDKMFRFSLEPKGGNT